MAFRIRYGRIPEAARFLKDKIAKKIHDILATELFEVMTGYHKDWVRGRHVDKMYDILDTMGFHVNEIALTPVGYVYRGVRPKVSIEDVQEKVGGLMHRRRVAMPRIAKPVRRELMEKIKELCREVG